jgi:UDP-glucose 4-epimerase
MQFVHEDDGLAALRLACVEDRRGTYNVAGEGILMLSQAARRAGRPVLPLPGLVSSTVGGLLRRAKVADFSPEQIQFLTHGRGVDTTRMRDQLGFEPKHTTAHAFDTFAEARCRDGLLDRDRVTAVERKIIGAIRRMGASDV